MKIKQIHIVIQERSIRYGAVVSIMGSYTNPEKAQKRKESLEESFKQNFKYSFRIETVPLNMDWEHEIYEWQE